MATTKKLKAEAEKFNYCIARPWYPTDPTNHHLCVYAYGSETFHGSLKSAKEMRDRINEMSAAEGDFQKYAIYQLVKVPE